MALAVEVKGLKKHYRDGDVRAVDGVDISTGDGEYLVLLGPSGCGKTTLLRTIAGLEEATSGEIRIDDEVAHQFSVADFTFPHHLSHARPGTSNRQAALDS